MSVEIGINIKRSLLISLTLIFSILVLLSCDKEVTTSPPEPEPPKGNIVVTSKPPGFKIILDGRFTGSFTPDTFSYIEEKDYTITLSRKYWRDTTIEVSAEENVIKSIDVNYLKNSSMQGRISFTSQPEGAAIYLNDSLLSSTTPYLSELLLPGDYTFRFSYPLHRDNSDEVSVKSSRKTNAYLTLSDTSVWVDYNTYTSPLPTNKLTTVTTTTDNTVWVGTLHKGIMKIKGRSFEIYNQYNSLLPSDRVTTILADKHDAIWIGTEGGLAKIDQTGIVTQYTKSNSDIPNNYIASLDMDPVGNIWVGTLRGLVKISNGNFQVFNSSNTNIPGKQVRSIRAISEREIWAVVDTFLTTFDGETSFEHIGRNDNNLPNSNATSIDVSKIGEVWVIFSAQNIDPKRLLGGIGSFDGTTWNSITIGTYSTQLSDILIDTDNIKWVASDNGLLKFYDLNNSESFLPTNSPILSRDVRYIAEDNNGSLWIATADGLSKYKKYLDFK